MSVLRRAAHLFAALLLCAAIPAAAQTTDNEDETQLLTRLEALLKSKDHRALDVCKKLAGVATDRSVGALLRACEQRHLFDAARRALYTIDPARFGDFELGLMLQGRENPSLKAHGVRLLAWSARDPNRRAEVEKLIRPHLWGKDAAVSQAAFESFRHWAAESDWNELWAKVRGKDPEQRRDAMLHLEALRDPRVIRYRFAQLRGDADPVAFALKTGGAAIENEILLHWTRIEGKRREVIALLHEVSTSRSVEKIRKLALVPQNRDVLDHLSAAVFTATRRKPIEALGKLEPLKFEPAPQAPELRTQAVTRRNKAWLPPPKWTAARDPARSTPIAIKDGMMLVGSLAAQPQLPSRFLVTGARPSLILWDLEQGKAVATMHDNPEPFYESLFASSDRILLHQSPDKPYLAVAGVNPSYNREVSIWSWETRRPIALFRAARDEADTVRFLQFLPGDRVLLREGRSLTIRHIPSERCLLRIGIDFNVMASALSPGARYAAIGSTDRVLVFDLATGSLVGAVDSTKTRDDQVGDAPHLSFSPDGSALAVLWVSQQNLLIEDLDAATGVLRKAHRLKLQTSSDLRRVDGTSDSVFLQWFPDSSGWYTYRGYRIDRATGKAAALFPGLPTHPDPRTRPVLMLDRQRGFGIDDDKVTIQPFAPFSPGWLRVRTFAEPATP